MNINNENLLEAINKSINNSIQLIEEGKILKENNRFARSYTLYQIAIEEIGKANLALKFLLFDDFENNEHKRIFSKKFLSHKVKTKLSIEIDNLLIFIAKNTNLENLLELNQLKQSDNINKFNNLKNISLYTTLIEDKFFMPSEIITEELVSNIEFYANSRIIMFKTFFDIINKDICSIRTFKNKI